MLCLLFSTKYMYRALHCFQELWRETAEILSFFFFLWREETEGKKQVIVLYHDLHTIMPITQPGSESALG